MEFHSIYLEKIRQHFYLCEFALAEKEIHEHLKDHPDDCISFMNLYFVSLAMNKFDAAKEFFRMATSINPDAYFQMDDRCILDFSYVAKNLTQEEKNQLFSALKSIPSIG